MLYPVCTNYRHKRSRCQSSRNTCHVQSRLESYPEGPLPRTCSNVTLLDMWGEDPPTPHPSVTQIEIRPHGNKRLLHVSMTANVRLLIHPLIPFSALSHWSVAEASLNGFANEVISSRFHCACAVARRTAGPLSDHCNVAQLFVPALRPNSRGETVKSSGNMS